MKIAKNKVLKIIVILYILSILFGIISYFLIETKIINENIINHFSNFNNQFNYTDLLIKTNIYNLKISTSIWISGILVIGIIFSPLIMILRGVSLGTTISSLIICFKLKGILLSLIILLINLIYDIIYLTLSYYTIKQSLKTIKIIKTNQSINIKSYYKNYVLRYIILLIILLIISTIDTYVISNIIKHIIR